MTTLINCTPHPIAIIGLDGQTMRTIQPSGAVARVGDAATYWGQLDGIDVQRVSPGRVCGLPDPVEGTIYIVSRLAAAAAPTRADLVVPYGEVRDDSGRILGVRGLAAVGDYEPSDRVWRTYRTPLEDRPVVQARPAAVGEVVHGRYGAWRVDEEGWMIVREPSGVEYLTEGGEVFDHWHTPID